MDGFFLYPLVAVLVFSYSFFTTLISKNLYQFAHISNNISLIFHFSFLSIFIIRAMSKGKNNIYIFLIFGIFISLLFVLLYNGTLRKLNGPAFATANLGLAVFCVIYYYRLFDNLPILNLRKEPAFWVITGIFFCMSLNIPMFAFYNYLKIRVSSYNLILLKSIGAFGYTLMHVFFIKAYLCSIRLQKQ